MQGIAVTLILFAIASIDAQYMNPYQSLGMGSTWPTMWRPPGYLQSSHLSSMSYPTWRSHPLFRVAAVNADKNVGIHLPQEVINVANVAKVPGTQEVLSHLALVNQNVKPMYDTIGDLLYEPAKARQAILTPVYLQGVNNMRANVLDDCGPQERGYNDWVY